MHEESYLPILYLSRPLNHVEYLLQNQWEDALPGRDSEIQMHHFVSVATSNAALRDGAYQQLWHYKQPGLTIVCQVDGGNMGEKKNRNVESVWLITLSYAIAVSGVCSEHGGENRISLAFIQSCRILRSHKKSKKKDNSAKSSGGISTPKSENHLITIKFIGT